MRPFLMSVLLLMLSACGGQAENNTVSIEAVVWRADASHLKDPRQTLKENYNFRGQAVYYDRREKVVYVTSEKIFGFDFRQLSPSEAETAHPILRHFLQCVPKRDCSSDDKIQTCKFTYELISKNPFEEDDPLYQVFSLMMARGYLFSDVVVSSNGKFGPIITLGYADYHDECNHLEADVRQHLSHLIGKRINEDDEYLEDY